MTIYMDLAITLLPPPIEAVGSDSNTQFPNGNLFDHS